MKSIQKYFLAILPDEEIQKKATDLKQEIKEKFNVKYALKSPAHVTLKMPFSYNEAKEDVLIQKLSIFLSEFSSFAISLKGADTFSKRVIFWKVESDESLFQLQKALVSFCKRELNLVAELSDRNYHPHMTIAFKDFKRDSFQPIFELVRQKSLLAHLEVKQIALLKREEGRWYCQAQIPLGLSSIAP